MGNAGLLLPTAHITSQIHLQYLFSYRFFHTTKALYAVGVSTSRDRETRPKAVFTSSIHRLCFPSLHSANIVCSQPACLSARLNSNRRFGLTSPTVEAPRENNRPAPAETGGRGHEVNCEGLARPTARRRETVVLS